MFFNGLMNSIQIQNSVIWQFDLKSKKKKNKSDRERFNKIMTIGTGFRRHHHYYYYTFFSFSERYHHHQFNSDFFLWMFNVFSKVLISCTRCFVLCALYTLTQIKIRLFSVSAFIVDPFQRITVIIIIGFCISVDNLLIGSHWLSSFVVLPYKSEFEYLESS